MIKRSNINDALRLLRLYCGYSQAEMAEKLSVAQSLVSEVERSQKNVTIDLLEAYSRAVGVSMSKLLFFAEEIDGQPVARRGQLIVADKVLKILEKLKPAEREAA